MKALKPRIRCPSRTSVDINDPIVEEAGGDCRVVGVYVRQARAGVGDLVDRSRVVAH